MARGATARLYDVDHDRLKFVKKRLTKKYDQGTIEFRARSGSLVDLMKLHESLWATRLSGGTRSGVISLEVTAVGVVTREGDRLVLQIEGSEHGFVLVDDVKAKPAEARPSALDALEQAIARGQTAQRVSGYVEGWSGRWPDVLKRRPAEQPRLMVTASTGVEK